MPDREKVIRGLEACNRQSYNGSDCQNCPYYDDEDTAELAFGICNIQDMFDDALALLKEQEPRVLTAEEMAQIEPDTVYWGEGHHVRKLWPMAFTDEAIEDSDSGFLKDSYGRIYEVELYNKGVMGWRLWTSRPSPEQMRDTKWEGDKE